MRELALHESGVDGELAEASRERLREAVAAAHRVVRARLVELSTIAPLGGVRTALEDVCDRFVRRGLAVSLDVADEGSPLDPAATAVVMRILTEALTNAEKHAQASRVEVCLRRPDGRVELRVSDDGAGFEAGSAAGPDAGHLGLTVMRQRAADAGGHVAVDSSPGAGTTVTLTLPLASRQPEPLRWPHGD
jgi:signal transduction histidine kinase